MGIDEGLLRSFCATHDVRFYLQEPLSIGEWIYATDGYVLVRVPNDGRPQSTEHPAHIDFSKPLLTPCEHYAPLVLPPAPELPPCEACDGTGEVGTCVECDGDGYRECDMGHEHDCPDCKGTGEIKGADEICGVCYGSKVRRSLLTSEDYDRVATRIGAAQFNFFLLDRIARLPGLEMGVPSAPHERCPFRFDGGIGAIMPLRRGVGRDA